MIDADDFSLTTSFEEAQSFAKDLKDYWHFDPVYKVSRLDFSHRDLLPKDCILTERAIEKLEEFNETEKRITQLKLAQSLDGDNGLMLHQKKIAKIMKLIPGYAFFCEMGTGKTRAALAGLRELNFPKTLILAPLTTISEVWEKEIKAFCPEVSYAVLRAAGSLGRRKKFLKAEDARIHILNFESFIDFYLPLEGRPYEILIIDESTKVKNYDSDTVFSLSHIVTEFKRRYVLSGLPFPERGAEIFTQIALVAPGLLPFSDNPYTFYAFEDRLGKRVLELSRRRSFWVQAKECLDLPPKALEVWEVPLSKREVEYYFTQVQAAFNGFFFDYCKPIRALGLGKSKLKALKELLAQLDGQVIVLALLREELEFLRKELESSETFHGGKSKKARESILQAFEKNEFRTLLAQPAAFAFGLNLAFCHNMIWFSLPFSYDLYNQTIARIHRKGQTKQCHIFHLLALAEGKKTIDHIIYEKLQEKKTGAEIRKELSICLSTSTGA